MALFWLSAAFVFGVALGGVVDPRVSVAAAVCMSLATCAAWKAPYRPVLAASVLFCLGCVRAPHSSGAATRGDLSYYNGRSVTVVGQIVEEPDIRDTGANYVVAARAVAVHGHTYGVTGRLQLHTSLGARLEFSDGVQLRGFLRAPVDSRTMPYREILLGRGIRSEMSFPQAVDLGPSPAGYLGWIVALRLRLEQGINRALPEPEAALLVAITLGAHSASLGTLTPVLVATGLIHLIAISGIKVALVAGTIWSLLVALRRRTLALAVSLAVVLMYVLITGATASGERSALMWSLVFIASYLGRNTVALVSLSIVAALMIAFDPNLPWDVGFQLSTVGTFSIVALSGPLLRLLWIVPSPFREALGVTLAAQIGTTPIVAGGFHSLSVVGPLANALVLPLLPVCIALGFLLGAAPGVAPVWPLLTGLAYASTHTIVTVSQSLARAGAAVSVSSPPGFVTFAYYCALGAIAWFLLRRAGWAPVGQWAARGREVAIALLLAATLVTAAEARATPVERLTFLGSGNSVLLQSGGHAAVIDGSSHPLTFLTALGNQLGMGVRTIDLIVVTDPRSSNVTGLLSLLDHYSVKSVMDVGSQYPSRTYAQWRDALRFHQVPTYELRTGAVTRVGRVTIRSIGPDGVCYNPVLCAGLVRLTGPNSSWLLTAASGTRETEDAVFRSVPLRASNLVVGDMSRVSPDFVRAVHARSIWCVTPKTGGTDGCYSLPPGRPRSWPL